MARGRQQQRGVFLTGKSTDCWGHSQGGHPGHLSREQPPRAAQVTSSRSSSGVHGVWSVLSVW